ncbi:MAG: Gfo/Idh/MocA family oxidoreductase [Acidimicrobiia bacterium]|nr:Gfo/Idh/MocA family oxidoreductase [Acidimicrobiia bacterium]
MAAPTGIVIGAGDRGYDAYTTLFLDHPHEGSVVGVAEPDPGRRARFAHRYGLTPDRCFETWEDILATPRFADFALVATGDLHHVAPTLAALAAGYHVLLEKPMALDDVSCLRLVEAAARAGRTLAVCHVYRFSNLFSRLHAVVASGALGEIVAIQQSENVAYWHYAHSYVRGLTRSSRVPWLLQKSCHDLDLIAWLAGSTAARVSSFTRPTQLTGAHAPVGAPEFCIEGCPHADTCPYDAVAIYRDLTPMLSDLALARRPAALGPGAALLRRVKPVLDRVPIEAVRRRFGWWRWPVSAVTDDHTPAGLDTALRTSRWGRCVYRVDDNDQPSSQTVNVLFENGVNAAFMLQSASHRSMRYVRVDGTHGSAVGHLYAVDADLLVADHKSGRVRNIPIKPAFDGHGGGERPLFRDFLRAVETGTAPLTSARDSYESHRIAFAAMESAVEGVVVDLT